MLKFGVIGCGMGKAHMKGVLANPEAALVAICDTNLEKAEKTAADLEVKDSARIYECYKEMIEKEDLDAAIVATPDGTHREIVVDLLEAGIHVMCEKPMALTLEDCRAMIAAEKKTGKKLMIGQICRYTPGFKLAKALIDGGAIGDLFYVESEYAHDYMHMGTNHWRVDPARHPIVGGGCHAVDLVRWIAGNPIEVTAYENHKLLPEWPINDCTIGILKFPNDVIGKVFCSIGCKRPYTMRSQFFGTKGTILCDNTSRELTLFQPEVDEKGNEIHGGGTPRKIVVDINNHNATAEIAEFIDILLTGKEVRTTGFEGAATVSACLAMVESAREGKPVTVDYNF